MVMVTTIIIIASVFVLLAGFCMTDAKTCTKSDCSQILFLFASQVQLVEYGCLIN